MDKATVIARIDVQLKAREDALKAFGNALAKSRTPFYDMLGSQDVFLHAGSHHMFFGLRSHVMKMPDGADVTAKDLEDYLKDALLSVSVNLVGRSSSVPHSLTVDAYIEALAGLISFGGAERMVR